MSYTTAISKFETHTFYPAWTSVTTPPSTSTTITVNVSRLNNVCTLIVSGGMTAVSTTIYKLVPALPEGFRPSRRVVFPILVEANGQTQNSYVFVTPGGEIFAPVASGVISDATWNLQGLNAGAGTLWTINFPSVSYICA